MAKVNANTGSDKMNRETIARLMNNLGIKNWITKAKSRGKPWDSRSSPRTLKVLPNGDPLPKGTDGKTNEILSLEQIATKRMEKEYEEFGGRPDHGFDMYVQHELDNGIEPQYTGCTHADQILVADGPRNRITTGHTKVYMFCTNCGKECGGGVLEYYSTLYVWLTEYKRTITRFDGSAPTATEEHQIWEVVDWKIQSHPYATLQASDKHAHNYVHTVREAEKVLSRL